jgi:hypothetical protein
VFLGLTGVGFGCEDSKIGSGSGSTDDPSNTDPNDSSDTDPNDTNDPNDTDDPNNTDDPNSTEDEEIFEMNCASCVGTGSSLDNMACAIDLCDDQYVLGNEITTETPMVTTNTVGCDLEDTYEAVDRFGDESNDLESKLNGSYALLGTGPVLDDLLHGVACSQENAGADPFAPNEINPDTNLPIERHDTVDWTLSLKAPKDAKSFRFKYVFFSSEYDDMVSLLRRKARRPVLPQLSTTRNAAIPNATMILCAVRIKQATSDANKENAIAISPLTPHFLTVAGIPMVLNGPKIP